MHQLARFSNDPKKSHGEATIHLIKYLFGTREKDIVFQPNPKYNLNKYVDADFCGDWDRLTAEEDISTSKSRSG